MREREWVALGRADYECEAGLGSEVVSWTCDRVPWLLFQGSRAILRQEQACSQGMRRDCEHGLGYGGVLRVSES